jgi:N utilization substance protein B
MKTGRRRAREFALQGLYQWQLSGADVAVIEQQISEAKGFGRSDGAYFSALLEGAVREAQLIEQQVQPHLDRQFSLLSPIERAILLIAIYELVNQPEVPYKVVINEAVELAKSYGGTDGFKYVNGVLDKFATNLRLREIKKIAEPKIDVGKHR